MLIQNTVVTARIPNFLKDKLENYSKENLMHVSQIVRIAVSKFLKENPKFEL